MSGDSPSSFVLPVLLAAASGADKDKNLYRSIRGLEQAGLLKFLVDKNGEPVTAQGLQGQLEGSFVTTSFGFADCKVICPFTGIALAKIGKGKNDLVSLAFSVDPGDSQTADTREHFVDALVERGIPQPVIPLFVKSGTDPDKIRDIQKVFDPLVTSGDMGSHSSQIILYGKNGAYIDQKPYNSQNLQDLRDHLPDASAAPPQKKPGGRDGR